MKRLDRSKYRYPDSPPGDLPPGGLGLGLVRLGLGIGLGSGLGLFPWGGKSTGRTTLEP